MNNLREQLEATLRDPSKRYKHKLEQLAFHVRNHLSRLKEYTRHRDNQVLTFQQQVQSGSPWIPVECELPPVDVMLVFWNTRLNSWEQRGISGEHHTGKDPHALRSWLESEQLTHWQRIYPPDAVLRNQRVQLEKESLDGNVYSTE